MASFVINSGQTVATTQNLTGAETGTIAFHGSIQTFNPFRRNGINVANPAGAVISNAGEIFVESAFASGIVVSGSSGQSLQINNTGTINSYHPIVVSGTVSVTLENSGNILTSPTGTAVIFASGDDTIIIRNGSYINRPVDGGSGADTLNYSLWSGSGASADFTALTGTGLNGISAFENIIGSGQSDNFVGSAVANTISGGTGNDTLSGLDGDDTPARRRR